ncbi:hypothetical protein IHE44_0001217 [Lamprotornis superbus]|uniref:Mediator of RNA polymerase II transcription subunit 30 n=1 Tax=Lamprotornis superbus TaxID=245042 RepID=A0A835NUR4_9PASS|nr:hypothetical protein IHE44_0001217 [Lamprotornis superbus]
MRRRRDMSTPPLAGAGMPPGAFSGTQAQAAREVNTASLCRIGQETVQDIVFRTMEIFQLLRNMQLPNGVTYHTATYQDRLAKLQEHLRQLSILFRKLRLVYDKCNENCAGLDPVPIEQLIPYVEEDGSKHDDRGAASQLRFAKTETEESAAEADHGSVTKSYLGHKCHVGNEELNKENQTL